MQGLILTNFQSFYINSNQNLNHDIVHTKIIFWHEERQWIQWSEHREAAVFGKR